MSYSIPGPDQVEFVLNCVRSADCVLDKPSSLESGDAQVALGPDSIGCVARILPSQGAHVHCKDAFPMRIDSGAMVRWHIARSPTLAGTEVANVPWTIADGQHCAAHHRPQQ